MPTTAITASIAGAQAVNLALRLPRTARRWMLDSHSGLASQADLARSPDCPCCSVNPHRARIARPDAGHAMASAVDAAAQAAGADSMRLSDALIWSCECANCGRTDAARAVELQRAADVSEAITFCLQCRSQAIRVEIRDEFEPGELSARFPAGAAIPARFAIVGDDCIDLQPPATAGGEPGANEIRPNDFRAEDSGTTDPQPTHLQPTDSRTGDIPTTSTEQTT